MDVCAGKINTLQNRGKCFWAEPWSILPHFPLVFLAGVESQSCGGFGCVFPMPTVPVGLCLMSHRSHCWMEGAVDNMHLFPQAETWNPGGCEPLPEGTLCGLKTQGRSFAISRTRGLQRVCLCIMLLPGLDSLDLLVHTNLNGQLGLHESSSKVGLTW